MKFKISIVEYLGKIEGGILALVKVEYNEKNYPSTYFYTRDKIVFTASEELESDLGHSIKDDDEYPSLIKQIIKSVVPYNELWNNLDELDISKYN